MSRTKTAYRYKIRITKTKPCDKCLREIEFEEDVDLPFGPNSDRHEFKMYCPFCFGGAVTYEQGDYEFIS